jgi:uncharacterized protein (DUF488 family)
MKKCLFTIGHSNRALSEFLQKLLDNKIDTLVDIRTLPQSRFCPWFNRNALIQALGDKNVTYLFKGNNLGGRGENIDYEKTVEELISMIIDGKRVCVMCSEGKYTDCHRHSMLEPSFNEKGVLVEHIGYN